jgi:hypothetical protein
MNWSSADAVYDGAKSAEQISIYICVSSASWLESTIALPKTNSDKFGT